MKPVALFIDDKEVVLSPRATMKNGDVLVPLEAFGEQVGLKIDYLEGGKQIAICRDDLCVPLDVGDEKEGVVFLSRVAFAPLSAFGETVGLTWQYDAAEKALQVSTDGGSESLKIGLGVGDLAPDFTLPDLYTGKVHALSNFQGQKTVFYMWASW